MEKVHSEKFLRQRRFLLVLPLLVIPFLTMAFWALGGGRGAAPVGEALSKKGINTSLPGARLKEDQPEDKLSAYRLADRDSMKKKQQVDLTSYTLPGGEEKVTQVKESELSQLIKNSESEAGAERISHKLAEINREINRKPVAYAERKSFGPADAAAPQPSAMKDEVDRLEMLMRNMQQENLEDPEMKQLDKMMEKILDIQHPQRVSDKLKQRSLENANQALPVKAYSDTVIQLLEAGEKGLASDSTMGLFRENPFYGLEEDADDYAYSGTPAAISAVVDRDQAVLSGQAVKVRLNTDVFIGGRRIPAGTLISGTGTLNGERFMVTFSAVRFGDAILPVSLSAWDLDGMQGIYIPGAMTGDAVRSGTSDAVQGLQLMSLDPSIGAQAAGAGIEAARGLLKKKVKLVKVTLPAGYPILLRDNNQRTSS